MIKRKNLLNETKEAFNGNIEINPLTFKVVEKNNARQFKESLKLSDGKLIRQERVETGNVKFSLVFDYIKSCSIGYFSLFIMFIAMSKTFYVLTNLWLSNWATNEDELFEVSREKQLNEPMISNYTVFVNERRVDPDEKRKNLFTYIGLGLIQSEFLSFVVVVVVI